MAIRASMHEIGAMVLGQLVMRAIGLDEWPAGEGTRPSS